MGPHKRVFRHIRASAEREKTHYEQQDKDNARAIRPHRRHIGRGRNRDPRMVHHEQDGHGDV